MSIGRGRERESFLAACRILFSRVRASVDDVIIISGVTLPFRLCIVVDNNNRDAVSPRDTRMCPIPRSAYDLLCRDFSSKPLPTETGAGATKGGRNYRSVGNIAAGVKSIVTYGEKIADLLIRPLGRNVKSSGGGGEREGENAVRLTNGIISGEPPTFTASAKN